MVSVSTACPDAPTLRAYLHDDLSADRERALDAHLAACPTCLDRCRSLDDDPVGPQIPDCHVVREVGRGRFGVVYKAWWLKGDEPRVVALKVLSYAGDMERSRFEREIAVLRKIDSPWIVKCLDSDVSGATRYYVMEFVEGVHLDEHLRSLGDDLDAKLGVLERVGRAVADAHEKGIVHRDLKPRNILIDGDGDPHVLDFGICSVHRDDWSSWARGTITHAGDVIGTLRYMSPEQAWGGVAGAVDHRSDIWALGIMLYEILTRGGYPYSLEPRPDRPAHEALLDRIRKELPRLPRLDGLPRGRDLRTLLERCLAWEPERRIQSVAQLADDLGRYRRHHRVRTKRLRASYRLRRLAVGAATRSRWIFAAGLTASLGLTLWSSTLFFRVGWYTTGHGYDTPTHPLALGAADSSELPVRIVGVFDETVPAAVRFAHENAIDGVATDLRTWRPLHGALMRRLSHARPRMVVWDYFFRSPQAGDEHLVAGVRALEDAGATVVLAAADHNVDGSPVLSPKVAGALGDRLRHGAIIARDMVERPGEFVLSVQRGAGAVIPSLPLSALTALLHPEARPEFEWSPRSRAIDVLYRIGNDAYRRERDRIAFTTEYRADRAELGVQPGDLVALSAFALHDPKRWERCTTPYHEMLTCTEEELRSLVSDRIILIGDLRARRLGFAADRHPVRYRGSVVEDVPGCYLLADALTGLLKRRYMKSAFPIPPATFALMLVVGGVGFVLPIRLATASALVRPVARGILWIALPLGAAACFALMVRGGGFLAVHAGMAGFSLLTMMAGSFWVELARNRHRVAERNRRAVDNFQVTPDGTLTLAPPLRRSLRAEAPPAPPAAG